MKRPPQQIALILAMRIFYSQGGRGNEGRVQVNGLNIGAPFNGGGVSGYIMDVSNAQEMNLTFWGGLGEAEVATNRPNLGYPDPTCTFGRGLSF